MRGREMGGCDSHNPDWETAHRMMPRGSVGVQPVYVDRTRGCHWHDFAVWLAAFLPKAGEYSSRP